MNNEETKPCPCGKQMIGRFTGLMFTTNPPLLGREWVCYGCGLRLAAPSVVQEIQSDRTRWEQAQEARPEAASAAMLPDPCRVVVSCRNAGGVPTFFRVTVAAVADGRHYEAAEEAAVEAKYQDCGLCYDEGDLGERFETLWTIAYDS